MLSNQKIGIYKDRECEVYFQGDDFFILNSKGEITEKLSLTKMVEEETNEIILRLTQENERCKPYLVHFKKQDELNLQERSLNSEISRISKLIMEYSGLLCEVGARINVIVNQLQQRTKQSHADVKSIDVLFEQLDCDSKEFVAYYKKIASAPSMPSIEVLKDQLICLEEELKKIPVPETDLEFSLQKLCYDHLDIMKKKLIENGERILIDGEIRKKQLETAKVLKSKVLSVSKTDSNPALYSANKTHTPGQFQPAAPQVSVKDLSEQAANLNIGASSSPPKVY